MVLHGLDARAHHLPTPVIEELSGPCGRAVVPELLKGFLKKVSTYGLQVVTEQIAQPEALFRLQILSHLSSSQRDFFSTGTPPSLAIRRDSPGRGLVCGLFFFFWLWCGGWWWGVGSG